MASPATTSRWLLSLLLLGLGCLAASTIASSSRSASGNRVLIVHDAAIKDSLSTLSSILTQRGYKLTFREPTASKPALVEYDQPQFDHLLLLSSGTKTLPSDLSAQKLVEFLRGGAGDDAPFKGGNVIFGLSADSLTPALRDLAREFSLEFQDRGLALVDHFRTAPGSESDDKHTSVLVGGAPIDAKTGLYAGGLVSNSVIFSPSTLAKVQAQPLVYVDGTVHQIGDIPLAFPLILPPGSSFAADPSTGAERPLASVGGDVLTGLGPFPPVLLGNGSTGSGGGQGAIVRDEGVASLVSAFQLADNSARALWVGSNALFSDELLSEGKANAASSGSNRAVLEDLLSWGLQERGVLRVVGTSHTRVRAGADDVRPAYEGEGREGDEGFGEGQRMYRVKDTVTYSIELEQYTPKLGWSPAPRDLDLQVTLHMIDPYITVPLHAIDADGSSAALSSKLESPSSTNTKSSTTYTATFQLPDRHGVFSFVLSWRRAGWTYLSTKDTAPVRPFNHDEHPRFLSAAWPYVAGSWSTVAGFVLFVGVWVSLDWSRLGGVGAGKGAQKVKTA
ncbi:oligosaccharyl transferase glycoprotein complex, beta subunit [Tilletia horrida]|uniref:Dolichyl-diphosphooligosaccharide--protein glycosyltransferase subunit WBP1 n=1 Tax=Tilletia horrida TaxID=155126 RepID=A0AAN6GT92_9BASI|nr:oligosaccharyl transferase glycoprotein complex, beta subunit [Tilletia horrida]KAK0554937.1 oligosaccharyl transferase glycoprotein complex, beta subunit [Tilletia horrida]KAK0568353.1 oligosaccharyl transferase glycoprotein complex, beta subunit [Tilletia horrida]